MAGMGSATRDAQGRLIIDGHYFDEATQTYGAAVSPTDEAAARAATPTMSGQGAGGAGSKSGPGVPTCGPGYRLDSGTNRCVQTNQSQASDLALQGLKNQLNGSGSSAPTSSPSSPWSSYQAASGGNGSQSSSSTSTTTTTTGSGGSHIARPDFKPASDANLLRAKERQGQIASSAVTGLRAALGERGMLGSGAEAGATGDIANKALQSLTDVNREQMVQDDQAANQFTLAGYQGDLSQRAEDMNQATAFRGQDIGRETAFRGQDVTARGQDIAAQSGAAALQYQQQQAMMNALRSLLY